MESPRILDWECYFKLGGWSCLGKDRWGTNPWQLLEHCVAGHGSLRAAVQRGFMGRRKCAGPQESRRPGGNLLELRDNIGEGMGWPQTVLPPDTLARLPWRWGCQVVSPECWQLTKTEMAPVVMLAV